MAALAEEYDLANGNITVSADNSGQYVSQAGGVTNEKQTTETVIKQADNTAATGNTITVETSGGAKAELTIEDLNVSSGNTSAIDVKGSSEAEITLKGDNKLETDDASVVHVSEGHVTITGDGTLYADNDPDSDHAKIGSNVRGYVRQHPYHRECPGENRQRPARCRLRRRRGHRFRLGRQYVR